MRDLDDVHFLKQTNKQNSLNYKSSLKKRKEEKKANFTMEDVCASTLE